MKQLEREEKKNILKDIFLECHLIIIFFNFAHLPFFSVVFINKSKSIGVNSLMFQTTLQQYERWHFIFNLISINIKFSNSKYQIQHQI